MIGDLKSVRFSHIVSAALLCVLTVVAVVTIGSIYFVSRLAVDEDISLLKKKSDAIAQLLIESRNIEIKSALETAVQSEQVQRAIRFQDVETLDKYLTSILYTKQQGYLDFLYIQDTDGPFRLEVSDKTPGSAFFSFISESTPVSEFTNRTVAWKDNGKTVVAIITKRHIISSETGQVLGDLTAGVFLNGNTSLLRNYEELSGAEKSALFYGKDVIASHPTPDWISAIPDQHSTDDHYYVFDDRLVFNYRVNGTTTGENNLTLVSEQSVQVVEQLTSSFLKVIGIVAVTIFLTTLVATRVISDLSARALNALTQYSQNILSDTHIEPYRGSHVREFNVVGGTLEQVAVQLKASEARFRDFADCGADWFWETDRDGRFIFMDGKTVQIIGLEPVQLLGKTRREVRQAIGQEAVPELSALDEIMDRHDVIVNYEASWLHPDGRMRYVLLNARPVFGPDGEFAGYRGVGRDVSAQKIATIEAQNARQHAEEASQAKTHFLASMSHELRTPLNAIIGFSEMLLLDPKKSLHDTQKDYLANILAGGKQLLGLVGQVLDLAAVESQRIDVHFQDVPPADLIAECVSMVSDFAGQRGIEIINLLPDSDLPEVRTDPLRLRQIVLNLLNNAIKYNVENGTVTVDAEMKGKDHLRLSIRDTGIGIPQDDRETIFRLFGSLHRNAFTATESYGIGLAVSKQLADALEGSLDFQSEVGTGTTFWVDIPCTARRETAA